MLAICTLEPLGDDCRPVAMPWTRESASEWTYLI